MHNPQTFACPDPVPIQSGVRAQGDRGLEDVLKTESRDLVPCAFRHQSSPASVECGGPEQRGQCGPPCSCHLTLRLTPSLASNLTST